VDIDITFQELKVIDDTFLLLNGYFQLFMFVSIVIFAMFCYDENLFFICIRKYHREEHEPVE